MPRASLHPALVLTFGLALALLASATGPGAAAPAPAEAAERPPNIVVVMTDDQDDRTLWAMPRLRNLVTTKGTRFTSSYSSFPLCCSSRATLLTGKYAHNHRVLSNVAKLESGRGGYPALLELGDEILPEWLRREGGYRTAHVGRYLNGYGTRTGRPWLTKQQAFTEVPAGWDKWFAPVHAKSAFRMFDFRLNQNGKVVHHEHGRRNYQTDVYARFAKRMIRRFSSRPRPLFLSVAPLAPHGEVPKRQTGPNPRPAPRHSDLYPRRSLPRGPSFNRHGEDKAPRVANLSPIGREQRREMLRRYRGRIRSLRAVDDAIGGMVRALRNQGELANTLFIFTSDQGFMLGEHRITGSKVWPYEEAVRVPLVVRGPALGIPRNQKRRQVVANVDLAPTILDAAGLDPDAFGVDGSSLLPLAAEESEGEDRAILLEDLRPGKNRIRFKGVRGPGWVYFEHEDENGTEELYDLEVDRRQLANLFASPDPTDIAKRTQLQAALAELESCQGSGCLVQAPLAPGP